MINRNYSDYLEILYNYWGCSTPINLIGSLANEIFSNYKYYILFNEIDKLFEAILKKVIERKIFDLNSKKWVSII